MDNFKQWILTQPDKSLIELKENADDAYYNTDTPILTDTEWDILNIYLTNKQIISTCKVGHKIKDSQSKQKLPEKLWSLDKSNNDIEFEKWKSKNSYTNYICQDKLDGVSALFVKTNTDTFLYTRGDGVIGTNISHLISYLNIPNFQFDISIRGEIIISKNNFNKYKHLYSNSRNMVSGCVNSNVIKNEFDDLEFICYEILNSKLTPSEQLSLLKHNKCKTVNSFIYSSLNYEIIKLLLIERKNKGDYDIDGIVVQPDKQYIRQTDKNPTYSTAVKALLDNNIASSIIVQVHWNICKWNTIKPKIEIKPVKLNGVIIKYITAYNAKYVKDNYISKGSHVTFTRSGDVIPKILKITNLNKTYDMPIIPYKWNDTNIDIISTSNDTSESNIKIIYNFFYVINVKNIGEKTITKFYQDGYTSINKILNMSIDDICKIEGFAKKSSEDIFNNIHECCKKIKLHELIAASGTLGKGFSVKKCKDLVSNIPDIFTIEIEDNQLINKIKNINGFSLKSAEQIVSNISIVKNFILENSKFFNLEEQNITDNNIKIVFSQVRPDDILKDKLIKLNYEICNSINSQIQYLVVKNKQNKTSKILKAEKFNINIYTLEEFISLINV